MTRLTRLHDSAKHSENSTLNEKHVGYLRVEKSTTYLASQLNPLMACLIPLTPPSPLWP
jgi:hypothetical protein